MPEQSDPLYASAKLREQVDGDLADDAGDDQLPPWTGHVPPELARVLSVRRQAWRDGDDPEDYADHRRVRDALQIAAPERATRAVEVGNHSQVAFSTGVTETNLDSSQLRAFAEAAALVRHAGQVLVLTGGTNNGKTNVAMLLVEIADRLIQDLLVVTNIREEDVDADWVDDGRYRVVETHEELEGVLHEQPKREKFVLVDDASLDHGEGTGQSHKVRDRAGELTRLAAKQHSRVAYLAHRDDGVGVAKHIRTMPGTLQLACARVLDDDGHIEEYVANIASGVGEDAEHKKTLSELPEAGADYDPDAVAYKLFKNLED